MYLEYPYHQHLFLVSLGYPSFNIPSCLDFSLSLSILSILIYNLLHLQMLDFSLSLSIFKIFLNFLCIFKISSEIQLDLEVHDSSTSTNEIPNHLSLSQFIYKQPIRYLNKILIYFFTHFTTVLCI